MSDGDKLQRFDRRTAIKAISATGASAALIPGLTVGASDDTEVERKDDEVVFTPAVDEYPIIKEAEMRLRETEGPPEVIASVETTPQEPEFTPRRIEFGLDVDDPRRVGPDELPEVAEVELEVEPVPRSHIDDKLDRGRAEGDAMPQSSHTFDNGVTTTTSSLLCGDLAETTSELFWDVTPDGDLYHFGDDLDTWGVDGVQCPFPDGGTFETYWHIGNTWINVNDSTDQIDMFADASYVNWDFPDRICYGDDTVTVHDHEVNVLDSVTVSHDCDIAHYGACSYALRDSCYVW